MLKASRQRPLTLLLLLMLLQPSVSQIGPRRSEVNKMFGKHRIWGSDYSVL